MPNFDQTGPQGCGEMSGRRRGPCARAERGQVGRRRHRNRQAAPLRHLLGDGEDRSLVERCITRLEARILALQMRVDDLKSRVGL
jgi:hypothetical protein